MNQSFDFKSKALDDIQFSVAKPIFKKGHSGSIFLISLLCPTVIRFLLNPDFLYWGLVGGGAVLFDFFSVG